MELSETQTSERRDENAVLKKKKETRLAEKSSVGQESKLDLQIGNKCEKGKERTWAHESEKCKKYIKGKKRGK